MARILSSDYSLEKEILGKSEISATCNFSVSSDRVTFSECGVSFENSSIGQ